MRFPFFAEDPAERRRGEPRRRQCAKAIANSETQPLDRLFDPGRLRARQLPDPEILLCVTALLLLTGTLAGCVRRPRWLGAGIRTLCFTAVSAFLIAGLVQQGPAARVLAAGGGITLLLLLGGLPLNLLAGLRLRLTGRGAAGEMIWNPTLQGRVVRRGLVTSTLVNLFIVPSLYLVFGKRNDTPQPVEVQAA